MTGLDPALLRPAVHTDRAARLPSARDGGGARKQQVDEFLRCRLRLVVGESGTLVRLDEDMLRAGRIGHQQVEAGHGDVQRAGGRDRRGDDLGMQLGGDIVDGATGVQVRGPPHPQFLPLRQHVVHRVAARRAVGDSTAPALLQVRKFFEDRVAAWDRGGKGAGYLQGVGPVRLTEGVTEVVAVAATLAIDDAQAAGTLQPRTRQALDRMWELQQPDGSWAWNKTGLAPLEYDDYFGAVYAALGVGQAPDGYARSTGRVGVVSVHQGPGLTNTMTGLTEAAKSRTPLLVLAGDVPTGNVRSNFYIEQAELVRSVGAVSERIHAAASAREDMLRALSQSESPDTRNGLAQQRLAVVGKTINDLFGAVTIVNPGGSYTLATEHSPLPVAVGFGVRTAEQARAIAAGADGVVVGSALVEAVRASLDAKGKAGAGTVATVTELVGRLADGVRAAGRLAAE